LSIKTLTCARVVSERVELFRLEINKSKTPDKLQMELLNSYVYTS